MNLNECMLPFVIVMLLSLALFFSFSLNIIFCIKQRSLTNRDTEEWDNPHNSPREILSQNERHLSLFCDLNHQGQQENPHIHDEQQENPIYGNIVTGESETCYETMATRRTRDCVKPLETDLNYASLDLKMAKKRKKKLRHLQGQPHERNKLQDQLPDHLPVNVFSEVDADMDAHLPPRDTSTMVSHSSIYLNSQQIAQETEEMARERSAKLEKENADWEGMEEDKKGESKWEGNKENEERMDTHGGSNSNVFASLLEAETNPNCSDHFMNSFNSDGN